MIRTQSPSLKTYLTGHLLKGKQGLFIIKQQVTVREVQLSLFAVVVVVVVLRLSVIMIHCRRPAVRFKFPDINTVTSPFFLC